MPASPDHHSTSNEKELAGAPIMVVKNLLRFRIAIPPHFSNINIFARRKEDTQNQVGLYLFSR